MVRAIRYAGKVYQNEMARGVQELGYAVRQMRENGEITGFEIEGVSDSLCERFSKRREEIERQIEKFEEKQGRKPTVKEIALITRETRPTELKEIATAEVLALQRSQLSSEEWTQLQALRARSEGQTVPIQTNQEREALRASVAHLFERQSVLREHEILAEALNQSLGSLDLEELKQAASTDEAGLVRLAAPAENFLRNGEKRGGLRRAVVICDEAGLKSNRQGARNCSDWRRGMTCASYWWATCASMFPWKPVTFCGYSKPTVSLVVARSGKFTGRFRLTTAWLSCKWLWEMSGAGWRNWITLNGIREGQSNYLEHAASDYLRLTDEGRNLDRCLAVSFSWEENHRFTDSIRNGLKERAVLPAEGTCLTVNESLRWTNQQKRDWHRYETGQVVTFAPVSNRPASSATVVRVEKRKVAVALPF